MIGCDLILFPYVFYNKAINESKSPLETLVVLKSTESYRTAWSSVYTSQPQGPYSCSSSILKYRSPIRKYADEVWHAHGVYYGEQVLQKYYIHWHSWFLVWSGKRKVACRARIRECRVGRVCSLGLRRARVIEWCRALGPMSFIFTIYYYITRQVVSILNTH